MSNKLKIVYYSKYTFKKIETDIIENLGKDNEIELTIIPDTVERKDLLNTLRSIEFNIFLHKNEHCKLNTCRYIEEVISFCYKNNKVPCYFDYGYFGHYNHYMIDYYLPNNQSSIKKIFNDLPIDLLSINQEIKKYIEDFKFNCKIQPEEQKKLEDLGLNKDNFITIWAQYDVELLRKNMLPDKEKNIINWFNKIIEQINSKKLIPVIKTSPCEINYDINKIEGSPIIFVSRQYQAEKLNLPLHKNINNFLNINSFSHVINCSSISNELLINNSKIAATGISWFNYLGIFHEPQDWNSLLTFPNQNKENIHKWINWWNIRQFPKNNISLKLKEIFKEFYL
jgi:hypothetical protein